MDKAGHSQERNLVIGANGFIGRHLIESLSKSSEVVGVYNQNKNNLNPSVKNIPITELGDVGDNFSNVFLISAYIPSNKIDNVERQKLFDANVLLTQTVCEKFKNSRIVFCSSVSVYKPNQELISEESSEGGLNEYGVSKLWGEKLVSQLNDYSIVRCSSVYGAGMNLGTIVPIYIRQAMEGEITVYGDGERRQNYIHVNDVVNILTKASQLRGKNVLLATAGESISNREVAEIIAKELGATIRYHNNDNSPSFYYNNELTIKKLDYKPSTTITDGLKELITWMQKKY